MRRSLKEMLGDRNCEKLVVDLGFKIGNLNFCNKILRENFIK